MYDKHDRYQGEVKTEARETEISRVLGNLGHTVERVMEEVASLEGRLTGVTRGGLKGIGTDKVAEPEFNTKLAQDINNKVRDLSNLADQLSDLRNRIEL